MEKFEDFCLVVFVVGVVVFAPIFLLLFFLPSKVVALLLSLDALVISLANFVLQRKYNRRKDSI